MLKPGNNLSGDRANGSVRAGIRFRRLTQYVRRVHGDERGAIGVLTLLMMWCLVAMLGMIWNTTEQAVYKQRVQTAADSAAQAAATLMARTLNVAAEQNIAVGQDASMEAVWRAVAPTRDAVEVRLQNELERAAEMKKAAGGRTVKSQAKNALTRIADEYQLTWDALQILGRGEGANYGDAAEKQLALKRGRQAIEALELVHDGTGAALDEFIRKMPDSSRTDEEILDAIIAFILEKERPLLDAVKSRTEGVTALTMDAEMQAAEDAAFWRVRRIAEKFSGEVETARAELAGHTGMEVTLATLRGGVRGYGEVKAPLKRLEDVAAVVQEDIIRERFKRSLPPGMTTTVRVDPANAHVWDFDPALPAPDSHEDDNRIWYPNQLVQVSMYWRGKYPMLPKEYLMAGTPSETTGWGQTWAAPVERYFFERVEEDMAALDREYWGRLDRLRWEALAAEIQRLTPAWARAENVPSLPRPVMDSRPNEEGVVEEIPLLPRLGAPARATAAYRTQVDIYNRHSREYMNELRALIGLLRRGSGVYHRFTEPFARERWRAEVDSARQHVAWRIGKEKRLMVLATYDLHYVPGWARAEMWESVEQAVEEELTTMNVPKITQALIDGGVTPDQAAWVADSVVRVNAADAAEWIATEFVNRPWPFEVRPSELRVPPVRGISRGERLTYFTVVAGARDRAGDRPRTVSGQIFREEATRVAAYAQAEAFSWMEFNAAYGAEERFTEITRSPWGGDPVSGNWTQYGLFTASPRAWRVSTVGGWNWRSRLSVSDGLPAMLEKSETLAEYMRSAGVGPIDGGALKTVNLH